MAGCFKESNELSNVGEISWLAERLLSSQVGHCPMEMLQYDHNEGSSVESKTSYNNFVRVDGSGRQI